MTIYGINNNSFISIGRVNQTSSRFGINSFSGNGETDKFMPSANYVKRKLAQKIKEIGDEELNKGNELNAISKYEESIKINPKYASPYYNMAKIYKNNKNHKKAITIYQKLLKQKPDELEALTLLGQGFKEINDLKNAKAAFQMAVDKDPKYDYAQRALKALENEILAQKNPSIAKTIKKQVSESNLKDALALVMTHAPEELTSDVSDVKFLFDSTDYLSGHQNIAQYENKKRKIVVTDEFIWAAPEVVAAYIVHELVHAKDRDGLSSIREEQDAYEESVKFWISQKDKVNDPELDYAAELYMKNPKNLREKVADIYSSRDKHMPKYSPNHHPPACGGIFIGFKKSVLSMQKQIFELFNVG